MSARIHRPRRRSGVATVEFALIMPFMLMMILAIWEIGRLVQVMQVLHNAAREGARQASTATAPLSEIKTNVLSYIQNAEPNITNVTGYDLTYSNATHTSVTDPMDATQLDRFTITVNLPYANVKYTVLSRFVTTTTLQAKVDWYSMKDLPVDVTTTLPVD